MAETELTWRALQTLLDSPFVDQTPRRRSDDFRRERASEWRATGLSPEDWAANNAHEIVSFSFDEFRFDDPDLDAWVQRLGRILFTDGAVDACRRRFLTTEQRLAFEAKEQEPV